MAAQDHWQNVYEAKDSTELSWYTPHLNESLEMIRRVAPTDARMIDVGGGASTLVDDLLAAGYNRVTVLDLSRAALEVASRRLADRAAQVTWLTADVTAVPFDEGSFDLWHDRAVFHFMTSEGSRRAYMTALRRALVAGGHAVIGTFSLEGPSRCSGLDVARYDAAGLLRELGDGFSLVEARQSTHVTPAGREQQFVTGCFRRE